MLFTRLRWEHTPLADDDLLNRKMASAYLERLGCPVAPKTLANLAANDNAGRGPPFFRFRWKAIRYKRSDLEIWAKKEIRRVE